MRPLDVHVNVITPRGDRPIEPLSMRSLTFEVPEEAEVTLHAAEPLTHVTWGEQRDALPTREDARDVPVRRPASNGTLRIQLTGRVGRHTFHVRFASGDERLVTFFVYPAKLHAHANDAWRLLRRMTRRVPLLARDLHVPWTHLASPEDALAFAERPALAAPHLRDFARRLHDACVQYARAPSERATHVPTVIPGGRVPARVDWSRTLDHWGRGGTPDHVAVYTTRVTDTPFARQALALWNALHEAALDTNEAMLLAGLARARTELAGTFELVTTVPLDATSLRPHGVEGALSHLIRAFQGGSAAFDDLPAGQARMSDLYELWVAAEVAAALGATRVHLQEARGHEGRVGRFEGSGVRVEYNVEHLFRGVGSARRFAARPDLAVVFDDGFAFVADVKYRPLENLREEALRDINAQLLRYMGAYHAKLGLALWPSAHRFAPDIDALHGGRAFLGKVRVHPADDPSTIKARLHAALQLARSSKGRS
ncbi:hypothetical protein [Deinococcus yavapaiensis]|uniref:Uncharacterized protein n=1 Tax=Deinococcus yavapaiensis KR-236 TaxID=694435 RepID=A0A318S3J2_9DEIO|nr:hypothetical protein [Deinococcus yavapaiensis]PYE52005.1 hypothetical protein DES52_11351 [Deinococcus yavapaiensis KR-236]